MVTENMTNGKYIPSVILHIVDIPDGPQSGGISAFHHVMT